MPLGASFFEDVPFGGVHIPCIYLHARLSYCRRFRPLLLCPLSVYYFPLFGELKLLRSHSLSLSLSLSRSLSLSLSTFFNIPPTPTNFHCILLFRLFLVSTV